MGVVYQNNKYKLLDSIIGDPVDWTIPPLKDLCCLLIDERDTSIKKDFFTLGLYNKLENIHPSKQKILPGLFFDPGCSIALSKFDPKNFSKSTILRYIQDYSGDHNQEYQNFLKKLENKRVLVSDEFKLVHCRTCKSVTIGKGGCSECGNSGQKTYQLYHFENQTISPVLYNGGKIVEGVVYHSAERELKDKGYSVYTSLNLKSKVETEEDPKFDLDTVVIDERKDRAVVILSGINPQDKSEKKQVEILKKFNIPVIFITTANSSKTVEIKTKGANVINEVHLLDNLPQKVAEKVQSVLS